MIRLTQYSAKAAGLEEKKSIGADHGKVAGSISYAENAFVVYEPGFQCIRQGKSK
nr:hypothetical protein [uncultured Schaedlerella sp.]